MQSSNLEQLIAAAQLLRPMLGELVFTGGCVTGLLITDEATPDPRPTYDVDAIVEITSYAEYVRLGDRLRELGFREDICEHAPVCRWIQNATILDVMPLDESILGFSNRWYKAAVKTAATTNLAADLEIRTVSAPYFIATKLEAFKGRGHGDFLGSRDLEDVIMVIDGRGSLVEEVLAEPAELRKYVRGGITSLLRSPTFMDALAGFLLPDAASQARLSTILGRLELLATR